jgi:ribose 5-phosphate isomerase A
MILLVSARPRFVPILTGHAREASIRAIAPPEDGRPIRRLGTHVPVPVQVSRSASKRSGQRLRAGAGARLRLSPGGGPFITENGNRILDCNFGLIADPARLEQRIGRIVGVVGSGLFISRADRVFVADATGVHRLNRAHAHRGQPVPDFGALFWSSNAADP